VCVCVGAVFLQTTFSDLMAGFQMNMNLPVFLSIFVSPCSRKEPLKMWPHFAWAGCPNNYMKTLKETHRTLPIQGKSPTGFIHTLSSNVSSVL